MFIHPIIGKISKTHEILMWFILYLSGIWESVKILKKIGELWIDSMSKLHISKILKLKRAKKVIADDFISLFSKSRENWKIRLEWMCTNQRRSDQDHCIGMSKAGILDAKLAIAYHNKRKLDQAVECFKELTTEDHFRLDNLDTYSNVLYVKDQRVELAHLAHHTV